MCERAAELGHSLLFPAICRYCGEHIYLFATPEGGFAIFDDVGGDWPKHECWGIDQTTTRYSDIAPTYSRTCTFPVPHAAPIVTPSPGARLVGTIVDQENQPRAGIWPSSLFDGRSVHKLATDAGDLLGRCVRGVVQLRGSVSVLTFVEILSPEEHLAPAPQLQARAAPTEVLILKPPDIWSLQAHADALAKTHPAAAATLSKALDAFLNGYTLAGMLLLTRVLSHHAEQVAAKVKASVLRVVLLAVRDLKLHAVLPVILSRLSNRTISAMSEDTRQLLEETHRLGELQRHFVVPDRIRQSFERRLKTERRYLVHGETGIDLGADFDALWQS